MTNIILTQKVDKIFHNVVLTHETKIKQEEIRTFVSVYTTCHQIKRNSTLRKENM